MLVVWALKVSVVGSITPVRLCSCNMCCITADLPTPLLPAPTLLNTLKTLAFEPHGMTHDDTTVARNDPSHT